MLVWPALSLMCWSRGLYEVGLVGVVLRRRTLSLSEVGLVSSERRRWTRSLYEVGLAGAGPAPEVTGGYVQEGLVSPGKNVRLWSEHPHPSGCQNRARTACGTVRDGAHADVQFCACH